MSGVTRDVIRAQITALAGETTTTSYTITPSAGTGSNISPSTAQTVVSGKDRGFYCYPSPTYQLYQIKIDGVAINPNTDPQWVGSIYGGMYLFEDVAANHTIAVTANKPA